MPKNTIFILVAIVAVIAVAGCAIFLLGGQHDQEPDGPAFEMTIDSEDDVKTVTIACNEDRFVKDMEKSGIIIFIVPLDNYIDDSGVFDSAKFIDEMNKEGAYDERTGEYLPSFTKTIIEYKLTQDGQKKISFEFSDDSEYASYVIFFGKGSLVGMDEITVSAYDLPGVRYVDTDPSVSIENYLYENVEGSLICLSLSNTEVSPHFNVNDIKLEGILKTLEVTDIVLDDNQNFTLKTKGVIEKSHSPIGYITLSDKATTSGQTLSLVVEVISTEISIDETTLGVIGHTFYFDMIISDSLYKTCSKIAIGFDEFDMKECKEYKVKGYKVLNVAIETPCDNIYDCIDYLMLLVLSIYGDDPDIPECILPMTITGALLFVDVDIIPTYDEYNFMFVMTPYVFNGEIAKITKENVSFDSNYLNPEIDVDEKGRIIFKSKGFTDSFFTGMLIISNGVKEPWGGIAEQSFAIVNELVNVDVSNPADIGAIIKALNGFKTASNVFSVLTVVTIVGGILTSALGGPDSTTIAIGELTVSMEQLKVIVAEQTALLKEMDQKLNDILAELKSIELLELKKLYNEYIEANNELNRAIHNYYNEVKWEIWQLVFNPIYTEKNFYIYVTEDGDLDVMPGDFFTEYTSGVSINGKTLSFKNTIKIPNITGVTFEQAIAKGSFCVDTGKDMIEDLKNVVFDMYGVEHTFDTGKVKKTYTYEQLAELIYKSIVTKYAHKVANDKDVGTKVLDSFCRYTEKMASLTVDPSGKITIGDLGANPINSWQKIIASNYNFASEAKSKMKNMSEILYAFTLQYSYVAVLIEHFKGTGDDIIEKHFDASITFLKQYPEYDRENKEVYDFCYVSNSYVRTKNVVLSASAEYESTDKFDDNCKEPPKTVIGVQTAAKLGIDKYINTTMYEKMKANYDRMFKNKEVEEKTFLAYLQKRVKDDTLGDNYLITKFGGGVYYGDGQGFNLYSYKNLVDPGHKRILMKEGKVYTIVRTMDSTGSSGQFKAYSTDVYNKVSYLGTAIDMKNNDAPVFVSGYTNSYIFAAGFYCDHVASWTNDESAVLVCSNSIKNVKTIVEHPNGDQNKYLCATLCEYTILELFTPEKPAA